MRIAHVILFLAATLPVWAADQPLRPDAQKIGTWKWPKFEWVAAEESLRRPVTFQITVPPEHRFFTVVLEDTNGVRVRNLLDMAKVTDFGGKTNASALPSPTTSTTSGCSLKSPTPRLP